MVHYHRWHQLKHQQKHTRKDVDEALALSFENSGSYRKVTRQKLLSFLLLSLLSCCLVLTPYFCSSSAFSLLYKFGGEHDEIVGDVVDENASPCTSMPDGTICCDRRGYRSDICIMKGDVRTDSASSAIFLYTSRNNNSSSTDGAEELQHEKIKPYTRKWETSIMNAIDELDLIAVNEKHAVDHPCDVKHDVPVVIFSTGGYTGNVYHDFNDGILPLYITSQHLNKKVVFGMVEYHNWYIMKYGNILSRLSDYPAIDFRGDNRTHCFPEAIVGLRIHDDLAVDTSLMEGNKSIVDFHNLLDRAYWPRISGLIRDEERQAQEKRKQNSSTSAETRVELRKNEQKRGLKRPKLVIVSRNGSRAITNEDLLVKMAKKIGFRVVVLRPERTTELAKIYRALNSSDVMIGVHGAAMTHFLFMKPGSVFIQVIPLGTEWAADAYYGEPARKLGLKYIPYKIDPTESSLYGKYDKDDPVIQDPRSVVKKGWQYTKAIYLESQNVILNLSRFQEPLAHAYRYSSAKLKQRHFHAQSQ